MAVPDSGSGPFGIPCPSTHPLVAFLHGRTASVHHGLEHGGDSPQLTGDDLRAVYVAQSSEDLFVCVDLWESVNPNFGNGILPVIPWYWSLRA